MCDLATFHLLSGQCYISNGKIMGESTWGNFLDKNILQLSQDNFSYHVQLYY